MPRIAHGSEARSSDFALRAATDREEPRDVAQCFRLRDREQRGLPAFALRASADTKVPRYGRGKAGLPAIAPPMQGDGWKIGIDGARTDWTLNRFSPLPPCLSHVH